MALSTFQKVTLATCLVLCVALLLPKMLSRGKRDADRPDGQGRFPPMIHRQVSTDKQGQKTTAGSQFSRAHNPEAIARTKGAGTGTGAGGKSNLAGQIIPIYGFGILLYILYILFKVTSKGSSKPATNRFPSVRSENKKRKITDFELAQLQEKLRETELVMENIVSDANLSPDRAKGVPVEQEENLLTQLREITRVMQEGHLVEDVASEEKTQVPWEDFAEEPHQHWEQSHCPYHRDQYSSPQAEPEAERTEGDGAEVGEKHPNDGVDEEVEQESNNGLNSVLTTTKRAEVSANVAHATYEPEKIKGEAELGVSHDDLPIGLRELELTLEMSFAEEEELEKMEDITQPESTHVRRRIMNSKTQM